jgi:hypothetical protein
MRAELLALATLAIGCAPPDASQALDDVSHALYRQWADAAQQSMPGDVSQLETLLTAVNLAGGVDGRSFRVPPPSRDDLAGVPYPMDRDPKDAIGTCVARRSKWPIDDNARFILEANQLDAEPTATKYVRTFVDPTDPSCFGAGTCETLLTDNDITRDNSVLTVTYLLHKHLRWVTLADGRRVIAARAFTDRNWPGSKDGTGIRQSYALDVFVAQPDATTIRYQCSWSQTDVGFVLDDGIALAVLTDAVDRGLAATDTAIGKHFHGE